MRFDVELEVIDGPDAPGRVAVGTWPFEVGRHAERNLVLSDRTVSRRHFRMYPDRGVMIVEDLGSTTGLFVNNVQVKQAQLYDGDVVRAGLTSLRVAIRSSPAPERPVGPPPEPLRPAPVEAATLEVACLVPRPHFRLSVASYEGLAAAVAGDFCVRLSQALRKVFPKQTHPLHDDALVGLGRESLRRSERYDLTVEWNIWAFCACMFVFGRDFDQNARHPWAKEVLEEPGFAEEAKAKLLALRVYMATGQTI